MKRFLTFTLLVLTQMGLFGQDIEEQYAKYITKADSLYNLKDFKSASVSYSTAFKYTGWKAFSEDRYKASCSWAQAGIPDSAFYNLNRLLQGNNFFDFDRIKKELSFVILYSDKRWDSILEIIKIKDAKINRPLKRILDSVYTEDQKYRNMTDSVNKNFGQGSAEHLLLWRNIKKTDSLNLLLVNEIINEYGWLGKDVVGENSNLALFLVIQHSDLNTQESYLPLMKIAVKENKIEGSKLALLIDRIEMNNGRKQIYGSQIQMNDKGEYFVFPIDDEKNVNIRRAEMGLMKLEDYVKYFGIEYHPTN